MSISVRVKNGQIEIFEGSHCTERCGTSVIAASTDGELIAGLTQDNYVVLYGTNGSTIRPITNGASGVSVSGGQIAVSKPDGTTYLYDRNGNRVGQY